METAADGGKMYYYNAATRATQWTKPEGPDVKILTQEEVEKLQKKMGEAGDKDAESEPASSVSVDISTKKLTINKYTIYDNTIDIQNEILLELFFRS